MLSEENWVFDLNLLATRVLASRLKGLVCLSVALFIATEVLITLLLLQNFLIKFATLAFDSHALCLEINASLYLLNIGRVHALHYFLSLLYLR